MEIRRTSAPQSVASASSEAVLTHCEYHWMPCVLMPRSWIGFPCWLHSFTPHTRNCPLTSAGRPAPVVPVSTVSRSRFGPPLAVVAVTRTRFAPAARDAVADPVPHVDQAPVPGNATLTPAEPLTVTLTGRLV